MKSTSKAGMILALTFLYSGMVSAAEITIFDEEGGNGFDGGGLGQALEDNETEPGTVSGRGMGSFRRGAGVFLGLGDCSRARNDGEDAPVTGCAAARNPTLVERC